MTSSPCAVETTPPPTRPRAPRGNREQPKMAIHAPKHRRAFLETAACASIAAVHAGLKANGATWAPSRAPHLACNEYPWWTFYRRDGKEFRDDLGASLGQLASAGFDGFEPIADSPEFVDQLAPLLKRHGLAMRSLYVNSVLHDQEQVAASIAQVLAIASRAEQLAQTEIVVTNPSPIRWGGDEDKSDEQLKRQAAALDELGLGLRKRGLRLAYHNHDAELRQAAREFHHMLTGTDPENVSFCLDSHWIYRGSGDSQVALFDVLKLHGSRIIELHLRQSKDGVWIEAFGPGDIDYARLFRQLQQSDTRPHIVLEQAVEEGSPRDLGVVEAHRASRKYAAALARPAGVSPPGP